MARRKRTSSVLETARQRLAGFKSITPTPDFGSDLTLDAYQAQIKDFSDKLDEYNQKLSELDDVLNRIEEAEARLNDKNKRMLSATEGRYGSNSSEYEQVGGTRDDERKRSSGKKSGPTG